MPTPARMTELLQSISIGAKTAIGTPLAVSSHRRFSMLHTGNVRYVPNTESDAGEYGNGDEFAHQTFKTNSQTNYPITKYTSSEFELLAWALALGNVTVTGSAAPFAYVMTTQNLPVAGIEAPYFDVLEQIRTGSNSIIDRLYMGMAVNSLTVNMNKGVGRQNSTISLDCVGSGKFNDPSTYTMPAQLTEHLLGAGSLVLSVNGVNMTAGLDSLSYGIQNNLDTQGAYFPGSGQDANDFQIAGRFEFGNRTPFINFRLRYLRGSPQYAALVAQTTGVTTITKQIGDGTAHQVVVTFEKTAYSVVNVGPGDNGVVIADCSLNPEFDATNGVISVTGNTSLGGILQ